MLVVNSRIAIPDQELSFTYARSSGPGGQNVNKVNSKAVLRWSLVANTSVPEDVRTRFSAKYRSRITVDGEIVISSERYRDQGRNTADCLDKLRAMLEAVATPPKKRRPTKPSRASRERRLKSKTEQSEKKKGRQRKSWD
ncbi:MAG: alternative ribosome rescue aminoacyl-tRNA hydrolase ArfB [Pirellulales bacterium]